MPQDHQRLDEDTLTLAKTKVKKPSQYKVLLHNDDYTPMEFVVMILEQIFHKKHADAVQIMLAVHKTGVGVCGVYTFDIAESKTEQVCAMARKNQHPLKCTMEPES